MTKKTSLLIAFLLTFALGVTAVSAQDNPPSVGREANGGLGLLRGAAEVVSEATGLTLRELQQELRTTEATLADIIVANGASVDTVTADIITIITEGIDQAVAAGTMPQTRADELLANLDANVMAVLNGELAIADRTQRQQGRLMGVGERGLISAVTDATNLQPREALQQMRSGKTLGEVITENGGSIDAVIDAALATASTRLDEAVANGTLTTERADQVLARLETAYTNFMTAELPQRRLGGSL